VSLIFGMVINSAIIFACFGNRKNKTFLTENLFNLGPLIQ
jgi:hypothetical protein